MGRLSFVLVIAALSAIMPRLVSPQSGLALAESAPGPAPAPLAGPTIAGVTAALNAAGFHATPVTNPSPAAVGTIEVAVRTDKIDITLFRCSASQGDKVCTIAFSSWFLDADNRADSRFYGLANENAGFSKVIPQPRNDGQNAFLVTYFLFCKDIDCTQPAAQFLPTFGRDVAQVLAIYKGLRPSASDPSTDGAKSK